MDDNKKSLDQDAQERRAFLMKARTAAIATPAVTMLLAAGAKPASAQPYTTIKPTKPV